MPLFRRTDGDLVPGVTPDRMIMPFLMRGRNESVVYHQVTYDISETRRWLRSFNRANPQQPATLFHLYIWAVGQGFNRYPKLNRFVSAGRLYQRNEATVGFAAKKSFDRHAPLTTVKLAFTSGEPLAVGVARITRAIQDGRGDHERQVDRELKLASMLPAPALRTAMWGLRVLDTWNLLPPSMIASDPLFSSVMIANLGSVGLDHTFHHLYEHGNASFFSVLGLPRKGQLVDRRGQAHIRDVVDVRWSMDERISDGYEAGEALRWFQSLVEEPAKLIGEPEEAAAGAVPRFASQPMPNPPADEAAA